MPRGLVRKHKERDILHSFYTQKKHKKLQTMDCHAGNPCELISDPTVESEYPMIGFDQGPLLAGAFLKEANKKELDVSTKSIFHYWNSSMIDDEEAETTFLK
ncbi:hypothetical protein Tco_1363353 [Tanacetum coccineum]